MEETTAAAGDVGDDEVGGPKVTPSIEEFFTVVYTFLNGDMWTLTSVIKCEHMWTVLKLTNTGCLKKSTS